MIKTIEVYGVIDKYKIDKRIFRGALILMFALLMAAFIDQDFNFQQTIYVECGEYEPYCYNPWFEYSECPQEGLCDIEILKGGESIGIKPKPWFNIYLTLTFIIIIFSFLMNHLIHNVRYKKWNLK